MILVIYWLHTACKGHYNPFIMVWLFAQPMQWNCFVVKENVSEIEVM